MALNKNKDLKLYYSIGEVAQMFNVSETLLRFWEKEFPQQIAPKKSGRNVRQYTKEDIEEIRVVHNLVKVRGMKLAAARQALKTNKEGSQQTTEVMMRLQAIKEELMSIKKELDGLVYLLLILCRCSSCEKHTAVCKLSTRSGVYIQVARLYGL